MKTKFSVPDMTCGHCVSSIETAIGKLDSAATVATNLDDKTVEISTEIDTAAVMKTLESEGYPATVVS